MASPQDKMSFLGSNMIVKLKVPPIVIRGVVSDIEEGRGLTLVNVWSETNQWQPRVVLPVDNIADIKEYDAASSYQTPTPPLAPGAQFGEVPPVALPPQYQPAPQPAHHPAPQASRPAFVDPAIVSITPRQLASSDDSKVPLVNTGNSMPHPPAPVVIVEDTSREATPKGGLVEAVQDLNIGVEDAQDLKDTPQENHLTTHKKTRRRQRQSKNPRAVAPEDAHEASPPRSSRQANRGKGWRETPMLQDTSSFQPFNSLKRNRGKGKHQPLNDQNGWASEDVTDVQDAGDFDFDGNHAKFDKDKIFDEMRKNDLVDEADRLVSHNRQTRPKPGTAGGKNLHYSENVLDVPLTASRPEKIPPDDFWKSEADDGVLHNGGERLSSRQGSRRGESKMPAANRRSQSRKASAATVAHGPSRVNSGVSVQTTVRSRPDSRDVERRKQLPTDASSGGFFAIPSGRAVEIASPFQMINLENCGEDLGLTEDLMTENAGRGIAEVAIHVLNDPAIKIRTVADNSPATVVILAGNNKSGHRAVAAGRHLRNKGVDVLLCVIGMEKSDRSLSVDMTKQLRLYKNFDGRVFTKGELFEHVRKASIPVISMDAPRSVQPQAPAMAVTLILDALLDHTFPFDDLRASEQATMYEMIEWTNRNPAFVLSVHVPSGIDHTTGHPTIRDGIPLYIRPRYVVSMGCPRKGLFEAVSSGGADDEAINWKLFLVDVGFGAPVWKRGQMKNRKGIDFNGKWALEYNYRAQD